jgi:hypothetical protein
MKFKIRFIGIDEQREEEKDGTAKDVHRYRDRSARFPNECIKKHIKQVFAASPQR